MSVSDSTHVTFTLTDNSPNDANSDHGTLEASKNDFETIFNNFNENVTIKSSSGFFLEVAGPAPIDLAVIE